MTRFFKKSETREIYLVYGSRSASAPEPVIAVVSTQEEAVAIELDVCSRNPGAIVRWESFKLPSGQADTVSVLFTLAGDAPAADPIGVSAFWRKDDARAALVKRKNDLPHEVRTYRLGWKINDWPFAR